MKAIKHFNLITKHKWIVFKLCLKAGIPFRGLMHDLSKYSPTEFIESAKFYVGDHSPITEAKKANGYSKAWLHHKGRNKHHYQYWTDLSLPEKTVIMPYKYAIEMVCDELASGIVYNGKNWTQNTQLEYYMNKERKNLIHPQIDKFLMATFTEVSKNGINKTLTRKNMKELYEKYCIRMENLDEN